MHLMGANLDSIMMLMHMSREVHAIGMHVWLWCHAHLLALASLAGPCVT